MSEPRAHTKILLGIGGGIAACKAATVASRLTQRDFEVHVLMTPAAARFVQPLTFAALTQREVQTTIFPEDPGGVPERLYPHLFPACEASVFAVLPATADLIAKLAAGFADDVVCGAALALPETCARIFCPAMHPLMWSKQVVGSNAATLRERGWAQIGPDRGPTACGAEGPGRMSEPEEIVQAILDSVS
ncbi:flavoprotein [Kiritimatiella glycovorans]|uniref:Phosphopantothenoylcysteine decarboxylase/phosphopantothenate-cysteine ligase n=1 Tax=Kiritimatiella glycovorans TaxID=1307763 RepID=A0A0G3EIN8_9BACT|nr:flavoprotein [Kiritimatiella glycovorans]AKJ64014.1 Phosphopantothenoylcysteine decarboxylase/phosphopantothenate-cysteine ligase [Kiritimatiella glycovorans]